MFSPGSDPSYRQKQMLRQNKTWFYSTSKNNTFFKKRFYLFISRARGREREREGTEHQCVVASHTSPAGNLARNPGMCPDWELSRRPFSLQASTQSTEPHQPGRIMPFDLTRTFHLPLVLKINMPSCFKSNI